MKFLQRVFLAVAAGSLAATAVAGFAGTHKVDTSWGYVIGSVLP